MAEEQQGEQDKPSLPNVAEVARTSFKESRQKAQEWEQGLESRIREAPLRSVLIAAGVGVLVSLLMDRK